jgi:hypothetical protein
MCYPSPFTAQPPPGWRYVSSWQVDKEWRHFIVPDIYEAENDGQNKREDIIIDEEIEREQVHSKEGWEVAKVDKDGWQYSDFPYASDWYSEKSFLRTSQRRRWIVRLEPILDVKNKKQK